MDVLSTEENLYEKIGLFVSLSGLSVDADFTEEQPALGGFSDFTLRSEQQPEFGQGDRFSPEIYHFLTLPCTAWE